MIRNSGLITHKHRHNKYDTRSSTNLLSFMSFYFDLSHLKHENLLKMTRVLHVRPSSELACKK